MNFVKKKSCTAFGTKLAKCYQKYLHTSIFQCFVSLIYSSGDIYHDNDGFVIIAPCRYRFSWKPISTYMSLTLARLCDEWRLVRTHNFQDWKIMLSESRWRNRKAIEEGFSEIRKPLKKSESHWRRFSRISRKSESRWRKSNFERGKSDFRRRLPEGIFQKEYHSPEAIASRQCVVLRKGLHGFTWLVFQFFNCL